METGEIISYINNKLTVLEKYERQDEGLVYLGLHETLFLEIEEKEKYIYTLCNLVAFDLLVFKYDNVNYYQQKKELRIPKFEYGLTNTFYYAEEIFKEYKIPIIKKIFEKTLIDCLDYIKNNTIMSDVGIFNNIYTDLDFQKGTYNIQLRIALLKIRNKMF
jgi:hypothetical protein